MGDKQKPNPYLDAIGAFVGVAAFLAWVRGVFIVVVSTSPRSDIQHRPLTHEQAFWLAVLLAAIAAGFLMFIFSLAERDKHK